MRQSELGLRGLEDEEKNQKRPLERLKDLFSSLLPSPHSRKKGGWREGSPKSQRKGEKVGGDAAETDERKPLPAWMLFKLFPPSAISSFLSAENFFHNLVFTSSSSFSPEQHGEE